MQARLVKSRVGYNLGRNFFLHVHLKFTHRFPVLSLILLSLSTLAYAQAPTSTKPAPATIDRQQMGTDETPTAVAYDAATRKIYVGLHARDVKPMSLLVFDADSNGKATGRPRRYAPYPGVLPAEAAYNDVKCIVVSSKFRKLYLGFSAPFYKGVLKPLIVYNLNEAGEPTGKPLTFETGASAVNCDAIVFHPRLNKLYTISLYANGFSSIDVDNNGLPSSAPVWNATDPWGKMHLSIRSDGTKLYMTSRSNALEVADLDAKGDLVGKVRTYKISAAPEAQHLTAVRQRGVYFRNADGNLAYYALDSTGEPTGEIKTTNIPVRQLASGNSPDSLLVTTDTGFNDALTGKWIVDGTQIKEYSLEAQGAPVKVLWQSPVYQRRAPLLLNHNDLVLASNFIGYQFLGNRFKDLRVRVTLSNLKASTPLVPVTKSFKVDDKGTWLFHAYSPSRQMVYASGEDVIYAYSVKKGLDTEVIKIPCPGALPASRGIAVDDKRGVLYLALKDGTIDARELNENGMPATTGKVLQSAATPWMLAVNNKNRLVYALGPALPGKTSDAGMVPIYIERNPTYSRGVAVDAERGRIYVAGYFPDGGLAVWHLNADGKPIEPEAQYYRDAFANETENGALTAIRIDSKRHKLYASAYSDRLKSNDKGKRGVIVFDLDANGDPVGKPRLYRRAEATGFSYATELSANGQWLYEGGDGAEVAAWHLDATGEPTGEPQVWPTPNSRVQLTATSDGKMLIGSTPPSVFENMLLTPQGEPVSGVKAYFQTPQEKIELGVLREGIASEWINPEKSMKDIADPPVLYLQLEGAKLTNADVKFETALFNAGKLQPVKTVSNEITGNRDALFLPPYGVDSLNEIPQLVQTSTDRYRQYLSWAEKYALKPEERPRQFIVANGLFGMDDSPLSLEYGLKTLAAMGHNTIGMSRWYDIAPEQQYSLAKQHGINRFTGGVYAPPSYFSFLTEEMNPAFLDKWAAEFKKDTAKMGAKPSEVILFPMADEPGWYLPGRLNEVKYDPKKLAVFHEYLKSKGFNPQFFGKSTWNEVAPIGLSQATSLPNKRLYYWSTRFYPEAMSTGFAAATAALKRQFNPNLLTVANLANRNGLSFTASPGKPIGNGTDTTQDSAGGAPDWFDLARKKAISCIWTEDWFSDFNAMEWSFLGDLLRCSAREGSIEYGAYVVGKTTGDLPNGEGGKYKIMSLVGQGAKAIVPYTFGPWRVFGDGFSEQEPTYQSLANGIRLMGKSERLTFPGRPRHGNVAILFPQSTQTWAVTPSQQYFYANEPWGLHAALTHEQYLVDFVDEFGVEAGNLDKYKYSTLYVTAPNLTMKTQQEILKWVEAGGTLVLSPGAAVADEYNEPTHLLTDLMGAHPAAEVKPDSLVNLTEPVTIQMTDERLEAKEVSTKFRVEPLVATAGKPLAAFVDGKAAIVAATKGKGRILSFGYWPGLTYWHSADRSDNTRLPQSFSVDARRAITAAAHFANAKKPVEVSQDVIEARLLESEKGIAITLLNWIGEPLKEIKVTIPNAGKFSKVESLEAGVLPSQSTPQGLVVKLPLKTVDVLMLSR